MTPSKYHNRLHVVCRECGASVPLLSVAPDGSRREGELWLTSSGELVATGHPSRCPACGERWRGFIADSGAEARRYAELRLLQQAGAIHGLVIHPRYTLLPAFRDRDNRYHRGIEYEADFAYVENGDSVVEDVKGPLTDVFAIKHKLFLARLRRYRFRLIRAEDVA